MKAKYFLTSVIILILGISINAQTLIVPFENTWFGFNTLSGNQQYFLNSARLVDTDNDGDSDVVAAKYWSGFMGNATGFVVLKNNGEGFFTSIPVNYPSPQTSQFIYSAELNNDGFQDIIVSNTGRNGNGNSISVYLNQGDGNFGNVLNYSVGGGPVGIAAADFNGDNNTDLAVANFGFIGSGNTISILINNGNGTFGNSTSFPAGSSPHKISAGKINTGNFTDIAVFPYQYFFNFPIIDSSIEVILSRAPSTASSTLSE